MSGVTDDQFFLSTDGSVEIADGVHFQALFSGTTAFETGAGLVLVDTGLRRFAPTLAEWLRDETDAPVHTAVYTHGHVDHAFGLAAFLADDQSDPQVVGHRAMLDRFERYERTRGHNEAVNARQFGGTVEAADGDEYDTFGWPEHPPDTRFDDELVLSVGELTFELNHARGETDDHTWLYCPERDVLCPGDFAIGVAPNAGNPQKVQRYPDEWADALRGMAAVKPRHLCPGHGDAIVDDPDRIRAVLLDTADWLDAVVEATIEALEEGSPPHVDVVHEVEVPETTAPYLAEAYDEGEFVVRNVLRRVGGWWSGRPSELKPARREALATELASLAGDAEVLADRAAALVGEDPRLAGHLADFALEAAPDEESVRETVAGVYEERADDQPSLMARNLFRSAAAYARAGRPYR